MRTRARICFLLAILLAAAAALLNRHFEAGPKHARILFGPEGKSELRIVADEDRLTLTGEGFTHPVAASYLLDGSGKFSSDHAGLLANDATALALTTADPKIVYTIRSIGELRDTHRKSLFITVAVAGNRASYEQNADVEIRTILRTPAIAHFNGPLKVGLQSVYWKPIEPTPLIPGGNARDLRVTIGTFDKQQACWTAVRTHQGTNSAFPAGVFPELRVEFPPPTSRSPPITEMFPLSKFC